MNLFMHDRTHLQKIWKKITTCFVFYFFFLFCMALEPIRGCGGCHLSIANLYFFFFSTLCSHFEKKFVLDAKKNVKKNNSMLSLGTYKKNKQKWSVIGDRCWSICTPLSLRECAHTYHAPHVISPCLSLSPFDSLSLSLCLCLYVQRLAQAPPGGNGNTFRLIAAKKKKENAAHTYTHTHTQSRACRQTDTQTDNSCPTVLRFIVNVI